MSSPGEAINKYTYCMQKNHYMKKHRLKNILSEKIQTQNNM